MRRVVAGTFAVVALGGAGVLAGRALDREAREQDRQVREWCAQVAVSLAGCPREEPALPRPVDRREVSVEVARAIVDACRRAAQAELYVRACDSVDIG